MRRGKRGSRTARVMKTLMRNGRDRRSENPYWATAKKERVVLVGTDQRITSGPAAKTAAFKGRIHGCTRTLLSNVRFLLHRGRRPYMAHGCRHGRRPARLLTGVLRPFPGVLGLATGCRAIATYK